MDKEQQKKLITEIMNDDAKDGLYISPTKSNADMNIGFTDQWKDTPLNIGGQTKQTAVEWLVEQYANENYGIEVYEQAKQMEKEQRIKDYNVGYLDAKCNHVQDAENYLAEQEYLASKSAK